MSCCAFRSPATQSRVLQSTEPVPPSIAYAVNTFLAGKRDWVPLGEFPTWIGRGQAGTVLVKGVAPLTVTVRRGSGEPVTGASSTPLYRTGIMTEVPEAWGREAVVVDAHYTDYPGASASQQLVFMAIPSRALLRLDAPPEAVNVGEAVVTGRLGLRQPDETYVYDPLTLGRWRVEIREAAADGRSSMPLAGPVEVNAADGAFTVSLGQLPAGTHRLFAVGTMTRPDGAQVAEALESTPVALVVRDGTPVPASLRASREAGPTPFATTIMVAMNDAVRRRDVAAVRWETAADGATFEPITAPEAATDAFGLSQVLPAAGERWYRATLVNRHSGAEFTTDALRVQAFDVPKLLIEGERATFVGHPVTLAAVTGIDRPSWRWTLRRSPKDPQPLVMTTPRVTVPADQVATWLVRLEAWQSGAPAGHPSAVKQVETAVRVQPPALRRPVIGGPRVVETGRTYDWTVLSPSVFGPATPTDLVVDGVWVLPDGTLATGDTVSWTVRPGDTALRYRAWVVGYESQTLQEAALPLRPWTYQWPEWRLSTRVVSAYVPGRIVYTVAPAQAAMLRGLGSEQPVYAWSVPPGAVVASRRGATAVLEFWEPGDYPVSVTVSDTRGHSAVLTHVFSVQSAPPLQVTLRVAPADRWERAPTRASLRADVFPLVTGELLEELAFLVDGAEVYRGKVVGQTVEVAAAGEHRFRVEARTTVGRVAVAETPLTLVTGEPPVCQILPAGDATALTLKAACVAPQGVVTGYHWWVTYWASGTEDLGSRGSTLSFAASDLAKGVLSARIEAVNDKGQKTTTSWER